MKIVVIGLSLSSAWGNGHATTYRSLLRALHARGHDCLFLECEQPWYLAHQDLPSPDFCELRFYRDTADLHFYGKRIAEADLVVIGSFTKDGIAVADYVLRQAQGVRAFYDIDTPVTLEALEAGACAYLTAAQIAAYDLYLSFSGGPKLAALRERYGVKRPRVLYCSAEPHPATRAEPLYALSYAGTYSPDRQEALEALFLSPARSFPQQRFLIAGAQYPASINWPSNVTHIEHVAPQDHAEFYGAARFTLNLTREQMKRFGYSPSVRLFEAAALHSPVISDEWPGLEDAFTPARELLTAATMQDVLTHLQLGAADCASLADAAYQRLLCEHLPDHRAAALETYVDEVRGLLQPLPSANCSPVEAS